MNNSANKQRNGELVKNYSFVNDGEHFCAGGNACLHVTISHDIAYLKEWLNRIASGWNEPLARSRYHKRNTFGTFSHF